MELMESVIELAVSLTASIVRFATDLRFGREAFFGAAAGAAAFLDDFADFPPPRDRALLRPEDLALAFFPPAFREAFLPAFFLPPAFLAPPFRAEDFLAPTLRAAAFLAPPLRAADFFAPPLRAADFFAPPFLAADFLAPPFLDEALRAAGRLAEDFFAPPFLDEELFLDVAI